MIRISAVWFALVAALLAAPLGAKPYPGALEAGQVELATDYVTLGTGWGGEARVSVLRAAFFRSLEGSLQFQIEPVSWFFFKPEILAEFGKDRRRYGLGMGLGAVFDDHNTITVGARQVYRNFREAWQFDTSSSRVVEPQPMQGNLETTFRFDHQTSTGDHLFLGVTDFGTVFIGYAWVFDQLRVGIVSGGPYMPMVPLPYASWRF